MRGSFGFFGKSTVAALALATGLVAGGTMMGAGVAVAKDAKPAKVTNSPEFVKAAQALQKPIADAAASKDKAAAAALVPQLAAAEGSVKTAADRIIFGQWQQQIGAAADDKALQQKGLQNMVDSGQLPADKQALVTYFLGVTSYQNKDYATAVKALGPLVAANYSDDSAAEILADSYASQNQAPQAIEALKGAIAARKAAGGVVPDGWFKRGNLIAYQNKLGPQAIEMATMQVESQPNALNWLGAGQLVREFGNFSKEESLDLGRLFLRTGALDNDPKYTEREFIEYIQAADPRRLPGETVKVGELGLSKGALKASDPFVTDALSQARGRIAADKASLAALEKDGRASPTGKSAVATADAYLSYGEDAKAEEMYQIALQKGGIDTDRALTRLGIAQVDLGKYADAKATFAKVTGVRAPLAKLWSVYASSKVQ